MVSFVLTASSEIDESEPSSLKEPMDSADKQKWMTAMNEEVNSLEKNSTWKLVPTPKNQRAIVSKWIFKRKDGIPSVEKPRYKARLVAKGYSQVLGIDYHKISPPLSRIAQ